MPQQVKAPRPLSGFAISALKSMLEAPVPAQEINQGVRTRLLNDGLASHVDLPSPYAIHKGSKIIHLAITDKGRQVLREGADV